MKIKFTLILSLLLLTINLFSQSKDSSSVTIDFYKKIELSDGTKLSANIYKPNNLQNKKLPTILIITPYVSDENHKRGMFFARNGYTFITVDCRGRGNSDGEFIPFENDSKDGKEVVDWIGKQSWNNGKVGMLGGSYRGMNQWFILKEFPKNLKTIIPIASVGPGLDFPKYNNIFYPYMLRWLMLTSGKTMNPNLMRSDFWDKKQEQLYTQNIPFNKYDSLVGFPNKAFQSWLSHPSHDVFWQRFYFSKKESKQINIPILSITGHFDSDQPGALKYYNDHMKYGNDKAIKNHYLIIGPWNHGGTRRPKKELGGLNFKENAVLNMPQLYLDWFNWTLKDGKKPSLLKNRVMYYPMGENKWKYTSDLKALSNSTKELYLSSIYNNADDLFSSGHLLNKPLKQDKTPDITHYNPVANKAINYSSYKSKNKEYHKDQSYVNDGGVLIYHSSPLKEAIEVNGKISFEGYISMNVVDADFEISVYEITTSNESIFLQTDQLRARYRKNLVTPRLVEKNKIEKYTFEGENMFSRKLNKGSRIRFVFSLIDNPKVQKNYTTVKDPSTQQAKGVVEKVTIKLYHNTKYPSKISIPILK